MVLVLAACVATKEELKTTSQGLEGKIEQLRTIQRQVEAQQAELRSLIRELREEVLSGTQDRAERDRRDIEGRLENQSAQMSAWLAEQSTRLQTIEDEGRAMSRQVRAVEESLAQVTETVKTVGTALSNQTEQHAVALTKLEQSTKQADGRIRALSAKVTQLQGTLSEFSRVLHTLAEQSTRPKPTPKKP
jgi:chromosome segregation ATPase